MLEEKERKLVTQAFEKGGDELLERRDFTQKDNDLIRKMNMLADMVVVEKSPEI